MENLFRGKILAMINSNTINIIHKPDRVDRNVLFKQEMLRQGITDFQVWRATTSKPTVNANISESHKSIVRWAKEHKLPEVCIAEDDFYFPSDYGYKYFLSKKPKSFDIYLSGVYVGSNKLTETNTIIKRFSGLHFYIVHSRFYNLFLEADESQGIDNALGDMAIQGFGKFEVCFPMAAIQHETPSDNISGQIYKIADYFSSDKVFGL